MLTYPATGQSALPVDSALASRLISPPWRQASSQSDFFLKSPPQEKTDSRTRRIVRYLADAGSALYLFEALTGKGLAKAFQKIRIGR